MVTGFLKRTNLQKIVDKKRNEVSGDVVLSLYKGNVTILSRRTKNKAYLRKVSFEENKSFKKSKIENLLNTTLNSYTNLKILVIIN